MSIEREDLFVGSKLMDSHGNKVTVLCVKNESIFSSWASRTGSGETMNSLECVLTSWRKEESETELYWMWRSSYDNTDPSAWALSYNYYNEQGYSTSGLPCVPNSNSGWGDMKRHKLTEFRPITKDGKEYNPEEEQ